MLLSSRLRLGQLRQAPLLRVRSPLRGLPRCARLHLGTRSRSCLQDRRPLLRLSFLRSLRIRTVMAFEECGEVRLGVACFVHLILRVYQGSLSLCSMVREMIMDIRIETTDALGKIGMVSEDVLLQTLSKKILGVIKE